MRLRIRLAVFVEEQGKRRRKQYDGSGVNERS